MNGNDLALRPLRHFADFSGRSTRGELFYFGLLLAVLSLPLAAVDLVLPPRSSDWASLGLLALLACPILAMFVRRLHDVGWRGWWIVILLPAMGVGYWNGVQRVLNPLVYPPPRLALPPVFEIVGGLATAAIILLLLWNEDPEANRYGPNPRTGPTGEHA